MTQGFQSLNETNSREFSAFDSWEDNYTIYIMLYLLTSTTSTHNYMIVTQMYIIGNIMFRLQFQWSRFGMYTLISEIPMFF